MPAISQHASLLPPNGLVVNRRPFVLDGVKASLGLGILVLVKEDGQSRVSKRDLRGL